MSGYPPYAPYDQDEPPPPSVAEMITTGHKTRVQHKSKERKPAHPMPNPARPRGPKATDVELPARAMKCHARCLRKHNAVLTDRMARMARPLRRQVINMWREYANTLPPQAINRFRNFLGADEPFKPEQAYELFLNQRKGKKANKANKCKKVQKELRAMCGDRRYVWARKATVSFARGIQQRLAKPGVFELEDGMVRLSDIILNDLSSHMKIRPPSRRTRCPKSKMVIEVADKVAVWIQEILSEADDRMLMMDFDEDDEVLGRYDGFHDDFLDMMGGRGTGLGGAAGMLKGAMLDAFNFLVEAMFKKGEQNLVQYDKFRETFKEGASELKKAPTFEASGYSSEVAKQIRRELESTVDSSTPPELRDAMKPMIAMASDYLAQVAEQNKKKGPGFKHLISALKQKPNEVLFRKDKIAKTNAQAAKMLEQAKDLETDHDDPNLAQELHSKLAKVANDSPAPDNLKSDLAESIGAASKYLSQAASDEAERGPAFNQLLKELEKKPLDAFLPEFGAVSTKHHAAHVLKTAPGLSTANVDKEVAKKFKEALQKSVGSSTPGSMKKDMNDVIDRCADYLAEFVVNRGKALKNLLSTMKGQPNKDLAKRVNYALSYGEGAKELETAEAIVPIMPLKDIADEIKDKLAKDVEAITPPELKKATGTLIKDAAGLLSQNVALNSGVGGANYNTNFLKATKSKEGENALQKYKDMNIETLKLQDFKDETPEEKAKRLAAEKILGRPETSEERTRRLSAEKRLGRPETPEELQARIAAENEKKYGPENEAQQQARMAAENVLGRPETPEERQRRLEAEKRLGRPETPEEMRKRLSEEKAAGTGGGGPPETEEQKAARLAAEKILGRPETPEEKARRLSAEKSLGRPETPEETQKRLAADNEKKYGPENQEQQQARMAAENVLGRPETPEERQRRLEAEKRLGRPETPEEMRKRLSEEKAAGIGGGRSGGSGPPETDEQRAARVAAEKILGRPETPEEKARRLSAEKSLGRPETPEETQKRLAAENEKKYGPENQEQQQARMAAENVLGRPETPEERQRRLEAEKRLGRPETPEEMRNRLSEEKAAGIGGGGIGGSGPPETEEQKTARLAAEKALGRPETPEEKARRLSAEKRLGRPETPEETRKRIAEEQAAGIGGGQPETEQQKAARLAAENILGRPETPEEKARRLSAEKRLGRPETPEETQKRVAAENEKKYGPETQAQQQARAAAENILGRPESPEERQKRLEAERRLGRPETPEEIKRRLADERRAGTGGGEEPPETEGERKRRMEMEKILGRPETKEERLNRLAAEKRHGRPETPEEMRLRLQAEAAQRAEDERLGITPEMRRRLNEEARRAQDPEHQSALQTLHKELKAKRNEKLYDQPQTDTALTYSEASDWLKKAPIYVDKSVRNSGDTARLAQKFEKKLGSIVDKSTPEKMKDVMQDVVIESSRNLSEYFVAKSYKAAVENSLITEMQKRVNDNLVGENGIAESSFFAAQRLKLADPMESKAPNSDVSEKIERQLDAISKSCAITRNMIPVLKDHVTHVSDYLSEHVGKPSPRIEAYVRLLEEMEKVGGDEYLVDGNIKKTYKEAATYLRQLTSFKDKINRPDGNLYSSIDSKLSSLMKNITSDKFTQTTMQGAISENSRLLASYISSLNAKTEALNMLVEKMNEDGNNVLLRHGIVRKTFKDGVITLRGKTADQLEVPTEDADPVPCRKIQIKLETFMGDKTPPLFADVMDSVIEDVTKYLATALLNPQTLKVCKCMKNVFVQCELWCEEILRRLAKPCCVCSRVISTAAIDDLIEPGVRVRVVPGTSTVSTPGIDIVVKPCPMLAKHPAASASCPIVPNAHCCPGLVKAMNRSTTSYMVYETMRNKHQVPTRLPRSDSQNPSISYTPTLESKGTASSFDINSFNAGRSCIKEENEPRTFRILEATKDKPVGVAPSEDTEIQNTQMPARYLPAQETTDDSYETRSPSLTGIYSLGGDDDVGLSLSGCVSSIETQAVTTEQMSDWHALLVSLMWNVQAWRGWLQENINRGLNYCYNPGPAQGDDKSALQEKDCWNKFQRKVIREALQWRQYNIFSRQLTLRLGLRYRDKEILSPDRETKKTKEYLECQCEILGVISMFNHWTQWLMSIVKEAENIKPTASDSLSISLHPERWKYFKRKVEQNSADWTKYKIHLKVVWERKYNSIISEWLPSWQQPGPVWVVSACGAVPSGAVVAGEHDHETIFVARTMHKGAVYPAALLPAKHCCIVYAEGTTFFYTKYQVMCNASVRWIKWRAGEVAPRAVRVSAGVHVGRVRYRGTHLLGAVRAPAHRCHVVICGRAFAFNCYDLLVLADEDFDNENK